MKVPFTKAHGAKNDFLLTWKAEAPKADLPRIARAICDRHTGAGADGWLLVTPADGVEIDGGIDLYNSDGSVAEISGNGTRCAAAFLIQHGCTTEAVRIRTGAGIKSLRLVRRTGLIFEFEMNMGKAEIQAARFELPLSTGPRDVSLIWVGNPQCAVPVERFDFDWRAMGAEIESHPRFPHHTNVSFWRVLDPQTIEARFYERGAGETSTSATRPTARAAAAVARGPGASPVQVLTPAGPSQIRVDNEIYLTGPAEIVAEGNFFTGQ